MISKKLSSIIFLCFITQVNVSLCKEISLMTLNTYCFPKDITNVLKNFGIIDLQSNVKKPLSSRIDEIATFIKIQNPDIMLFQELWGDVNKETMINKLKSLYETNYYVETNNQTNIFSYFNILQQLINQPRKLDDFFINFKGNLPEIFDSGLLILSKFPIMWKDSIIFNDKTGQELLAKKGALFIGFKNHDNNPVILVNTHLQSQTPITSVAIREKQIVQIGEKLKSLKESRPDFENAKIIIAGDINEPISYKKDSNLLVDRTNYITNILHNLDINVTNPIIQILCKKYKIQEILEINELEKTGYIKTVDGKIKQTLQANDPLICEFDPNQYDYFENSTEFRGIELIDHILISNNCQLSNYTVFRKEFFADSGEQKPYDYDFAITDHTAVAALID